MTGTTPAAKSTSVWGSAKSVASNVFIRPRAWEDIVEQAVYIAEGNPNAADRLLDAAKDTVNALANMPGMGTLRIFENPLLEGIRILHAARDIQNLMRDESDS